MSGILNSGKLATLLSRLTAARAGYLDTINTNLDATISSRPAGSDYTAARAAKLDNLDAAISTITSAVPTTSGLKGIDESKQVHTGGLLGDFAAATATESIQNTWKTILSESTASGILQFIHVYQDTNASSNNVDVRLSIDGNVVYTGTTVFDDTSDDDKGYNIIGYYHIYSAGLDGGLAVLDMDSIPFTDSFTLEFRNTEASNSVTMGARYRYYLT